MAARLDDIGSDVAALLVLLFHPQAQQGLRSRPLPEALSPEFPPVGAVQRVGRFCEVPTTGE